MNQFRTRNERPQPVGPEELLYVNHILTALIRTHLTNPSDQSLNNIERWLDKCRQGLIPANLIHGPIGEGKCTTQDIVDALDLARTDALTAMQNIISLGYVYPKNL